MNYDFIEFSHFTTKEKYCKLQEYFSGHDYQRRNDEILDPMEDFEITSYTYDEFTSEDDYGTLYFLKDFLFPAVLRLGLNSIANFNKSIELKGIYSKESLEGYSKHYVEKVNKFRKDISKVDFIGYGIIRQVLMQLEIISDYAMQYFDDPYPNIKDKIQFNWNRTDVLYFFHLLRENNAISWIEDVDLGRIIDSAIEYKEKRGDRDYKPMKESRKQINGFKNVGKPVRFANERIKYVFTNEDFYNIK